MTQRNRASGWQHAKLSGHTNEARVKELLDTDPEYRADFLKRIGSNDEAILFTSIGGLHESSVPGVLGKSTKSKTDLKLLLNSGDELTFSIKKSLGGQVYFVRAGLFIEVYKKQFQEDIPPDVQRAINLFWAAADDAIEIIEKYGDKTNLRSYNLQLHHKSVNATTLKAYDRHLYDAMLNWFAGHAYNITKLAFAMGASKDASEWSRYIWYINLLGENGVDRIFHIEDICKGAERMAQSETYYGDNNGGTTIQLPFGFVQWHQSQLQFHHSFEKVCALVKE